MLQKLLQKEQLKKTAQATGDLIGNKIADKINSVGKTKNKGKENEISKIEEAYVPSEKGQQVTNALRLFQIAYKNGTPKNYKLIR